jgi:UDP-N-acetylmuramoylalanine--D-glutamate ligase
LLPSAKINIAVFLNITPDHLDRHGDMGHYVHAKENIFARQDKNDYAIIGVDDEYCLLVYEELRAAQKQNIIPVSVKRKLEYGVYVEDGVLYDATSDKSTPIVDLKPIATLPGAHNWQNAAVSYAAAKAAGLTAEQIIQGLQSFAGLAHRQELIATLNGIRFINDSKATNPEATEKALACYDNIYWILGGKPKTDDLDVCTPYLGKVRHAFLIGQAAPMYENILRGKVPVTMSGTLDQATSQAYAQALKDHEKGVVLLSPACASFDQFKDYEQRGNDFRKFVEQLKTEKLKTGT